ncbi:extracellular solute-binding protein [Paenibacillus thermotolerans]|uniref:extracellular solute-binding protein n=1 Tax=Paenibacillus thermotolerans TaxID=3027807 RepID=UPI002367C228|nr:MULTISPECIES: extracellular solute-binding protein [unclassified Paenibacillus]
MRRLSVLMAVMLSIVSMTTGCGNDGIIDNQGNVGRLGDNPDKTVVVWHTYSDEETRVFEQLVVPAFEKEHPHIHIESVRQEYNQEYQAALVARASADKPPDVVRMDISWVPSFAERGLLYPISRFSDFRETAAQLRGDTLSASQYEEDVYGLPLNINTKAAIYNRALLDKLGLNAESASLTEVVEAAKKHRLVLGMSGIELWASLPYFFGLGGKLADEHFTQTAGYFNSEESVLAAETLLRLYKEKVINPAMFTGSADLWNDIQSENKSLLMIDEGPWYYSILLNSKNLKTDLLTATDPEPFPRGESRFGSVIGGENLVLTKGSRVKDEAWTFMKWMMRKDTQQMLFHTGLIPTNMEAFRDSAAVREKNPYIDAYMKGIEEAFYRPAIPQWSRIEQIYNDAMEDIFIKGRPAKEALDEAAAKMDRALAEK